MTPNQHVVALEPETGRELWNFDAHAGKGSVGRGVAFWAGDETRGPRIVFGTDKAQLVELDASTGQAVEEFGNSGVVDLGADVFARYPRARYAITSPPAIYRNLVILGPEVPEGPSHGPPGDVRAFDVKTGKLVWRFDPLQHFDAAGKPTWGPEGWKDRTGPSVWGFYTLDLQTGTIFIPVGNPADSFYGADRPG
jgi:glucose dehydrogenase